MSEQSTSKGFVIGFIIGVLFVIFLVSIIPDDRMHSYKVGQADALSGKKIRVELITHPDSTRTWEWKKHVQ